MNFAEMTQRVQDRISDASTTTEAIIQEKINETLTEIQERVPTARWYYRESAFNTRPDSQAGEVSRKLQGSRLIFVSAAADIGKHRIGASIRIDDDGQRYTVEDVGLPNVRPAVDFTGSAESISNMHRYVQIDRPYGGASDASGGAGHDLDVQQDIYMLRSDVNILAWMVNHDFPQQTFAVDPTVVRFFIPDQFDQGARGLPWMHEALGRRSMVWIDDTVNPTGVAHPAVGAATAAVANGSAQVLISGLEVSHDGDVLGGMFGATTIAESLAGHAFRVKGTERWYIIMTAEISDDTKLRLLLETKFQGTSNNDAAFEIGPQDAPLVRLYAVPDTAQKISYGYYVREQILEADEDRPILPVEHQTTIIDGAIWRMLQFVESQAQHAAFHRYDRGLERIQKANIRRVDRVRQLQGHDIGNRQGLYVNLGPNYPPYRIGR